MRITLKCKDGSGNTEYLSATRDRVWLTTPSQTPLALSNTGADGVHLDAALRRLARISTEHRAPHSEIAEAALKIARFHCKFRRDFEVFGIEAYWLGSDAPAGAVYSVEVHGYDEGADAFNVVIVRAGEEPVRKTVDALILSLLVRQSGEPSEFVGEVFPIQA